MGRKYWNRSRELRKLIEVLRAQGVTNVEELTRQFVEFVKGYAEQLHIRPLNRYEVEYIWVMLMD